MPQCARPQCTATVASPPLPAPTAFTCSDSQTVKCWRAPSPDTGVWRGRKNDRLVAIATAIAMEPGAMREKCRWTQPQNRFCERHQLSKSHGEGGAVLGLFAPRWAKVGWPMAAIGRQCGPRPHSTFFFHNGPSDQ